MSTIEIEKEIDKLGLSEKLLLVEDIWDMISKDNKNIPLSEWQKEELDRRYNTFLKGNEPLLDWKSVHAEIRSNSK